MRRKGLWYLVFLILIVFLGMELLLPRFAENQIRAGLQARTSSIEKLDIRVNSFPPWEILSGHLDRVEIKARGVMVNDLYLKSLSGHYQDLLLKGEEIQGKNTDLNILITEDALNKYINIHYPTLDNFKVKLNPGQLYLSGFIKFFEARVRTQLTGNFIVTEVNKISFVPEHFQIEEINIPVSIVQNVIKELGFSLDLTQLNIPLLIEDIKISSGEIYIIGGISARKAGL